MWQDENDNRMNLTNPEQRDAFINEQEVFKVVDCYLQSCSAVGDTVCNFD